MLPEDIEHSICQFLRSCSNCSLSLTILQIKRKKCSSLLKIYLIIFLNFLLKYFLNNFKKDIFLKFSYLILSSIK